MIVILLGLCALQGCGGSGGTMPSASTPQVAIALTPSGATLPAGGSQRFIATVTGASDRNVTWSVGLVGSSGNSAAIAVSPGVINTDGVYIAPTNVPTTTTVEITAVSVANSNSSASATVTVNPPTIAVAPTTATVQAGGQQAFTAALTGPSGPGIQWGVNGIVGGNSISGTISQQGIYTAPAINPGAMVTISASSSANSDINGSAAVTVVNPPTPPLAGVTYAQALSSWEAVITPSIQDRSGLGWDDNARTWSPVPSWAPPATGIGVQIYDLEPFLRPATRMAIARTDIALMERLANFHMGMLQWRTTTVGTMIQNAGANPVVLLSGPSTARTFAWYQPYSSTRMEVTEDVLANAQYLSQASQLLRAIAELPAASRTAPLLQFVQGFSGFLVTDQLLRLMYGSYPWSHYQNPNIPQPVVSAWQFLAQTGYEPPHPYKYQAAMTDTELWLVADSAEVLGADAAAPELAILDSSSRAQLQQAVLAGVSLMQARCHHVVAPDGADVLSAFAGDLDDYPTLAYTADTGPAVPTAPNPQAGLMWDIDHSYRFPIVFRSLYETQSATGAGFPKLNDLVALANTYVHLAFNGDAQLPAFSNFLDGSDGWFDVGDPSLADGYPPEQYCNALQSPINCLTAGAVQGWGELAFANPNLAKLTQNLVDLAYDDSPATIAFKDQHYTYVEPYSVQSGQYPWLMIYVVGDSAERLP